MKQSHVMFICTIGLLVALAAGVSAENREQFKLNWYGAFTLDGAYDQNLTSHGNFAMWVEPQALNQDDEQFNMTANATRFGVRTEGARYDNIDINGQLEFDLYAGYFGANAEENNPVLQLRHAYFTLQSPTVRLTAGQTNDLVSPLSPNTLNYTQLWGSGNIGYRRPQISLAYIANVQPNMSVTVAGGVFRTIGENLTPTFSLALGETNDYSDDGTDAGIPSMQAMIDINHRSQSGNTIRLGVSGLYGKLKAETNLGNYEKYESWAVVGHASLQMTSGFGIATEVFSGANLGSYYGGILNDSRIDGVRAMGGWISANVQPNEKIRVNSGFGIDDPKDVDLVFSDARTQNRCVFANLSYAIVPQASIGFEISHWETRYVSERSENLRAQTSISLNF
jgi:hypothetical protein